MACELERVYGRIAAHEPYNRTLDRTFEIAQPNDFEIDARRRKSGAGGHDQVGDFLVPVDKPIDRLRRKARRFLVVFSHSCSGRGKVAGDIKSVIVERFIEAGLGWTERRPATPYVRSGSHSLKEKPRAPVLYHAVGKPHERCMDVVVGSGDAETV